MKITPVAGQIFVQEDSEDFSSYKKVGLEIPEEARKGVGTTGIIYAVHPRNGKLYRKGQRVIFDRFIAQDIYIRDEEGKEVPRLQCLPVDCILGFIR